MSGCRDPVPAQPADKAKLATDGCYGPKTTAAVQAFQKKVKLPVDGIVGPRTHPKLIITVKQGSKGPP